MNKTCFSYVVITHNNPDLAKEDTYLDKNKYKKSAKYAMLFRTVHKDNSETLTHIRYSSNMEELQKAANSFISWYNYPLSLCKDMQGNISQIYILKSLINS